MDMLRELGMTEPEIRAHNVMVACQNYGGSIGSDPEFDLQSIRNDLLTSVVIGFPNLHSATSWANTCDIDGQVNICWHATHFDEPWSVRYAWGE